MSEERWLPVPGYETYYEVSDQGNVRSLDRVVIGAGGRPYRLKGRLRKPFLITFGYPSVYLSRAAQREYFAVHQLVLLAFVGPRPQGLVTRHLNGNPADSRLENLAYGTPSENCLDMIAHGTHPQASMTHCKHGHPLSGDNLLIAARTGKRRCRTCKNDQNRVVMRRNYLAKKKAAA